MELFRLLRRQTHALIETLPESAWSNACYHPENGNMTLEDWLDVYAATFRSICSTCGKTSKRGWRPVDPLKGSCSPTTSHVPALSSPRRFAPGDPVALTTIRRATRLPRFARNDRQQEVGTREGPRRFAKQVLLRYTAANKSPPALGRCFSLRTHPRMNWNT